MPRTELRWHGRITLMRSYECETESGLSADRQMVKFLDKVFRFGVWGPAVVLRTWRFGDRRIFNIEYLIHCSPVGRTFYFLVGLYRCHDWCCMKHHIVYATLTPSTPAVPNCCCSKGSAPYWSNPSFLIFDIRALWRWVLSARAPGCQKLKMVG